MAALPITLLVRRGIEGKSGSPLRKKPMDLQLSSYDPAEPKEEQVGKDWMVQRVWDSIDPIFFVNDTGIACNNPGTAPSSYIPIEAGQDLTAPARRRRLLPRCCDPAAALPHDEPADPHGSRRPGRHRPGRPLPGRPAPGACGADDRRRRARDAERGDVALVGPEGGRGASGLDGPTGDACLR